MTGVGTDAALVGLGAVHGLNPGMGWLFAVALGLQERSRRALWRALPPLALGHAGAIGLAVAVAAGLGHALPARELRWAVAIALIGLGVFRLVRHSHPRGSLRVSGRDLALWSLLMATAHGAGIMVLPLVLPSVGMSAAHAAHAGVLLAGVGAGLPVGWSATVLHTVGYLVVTMLAAVLVYERLGVGVLRRAWVNLDLVWAGALILTGALTAVL
ncbi:MAG TPA: hypothetical protein VJQ44_02600 [Gemmatimonadales bacterium]|nr:hypothetical protein [Gemmatimonadales bacterium]